MKLNYRIGIGTKIIFIVTLMVISSIGIVVYIASDLFQEDSITRVQESNKESAENLGERVQAILEDSFNRLTLMAQFATRSQSQEEAIRAISNTLGGSDDIISFFAYQISEQGQLVSYYSVVLDNVLAEFNVTSSHLQDRPKDFLIKNQLNEIDKVVISNSAPYLGIPLFSMSFISNDSKNTPIPLNLSSDEKLRSLKGRWFFRAELRQDSILKLFSDRKFNTSYLVDKEGRLMAHSDKSMIHQVLQAIDFSTTPIVWKMLESSVDNQQMEYVGEDGESYLGAFKKISISGLGVVTEVHKRLALATINRVQYRSFLVMVIVVCLAYILNILFSNSLTAPIRNLFEATEQIVLGNFNVNLQASSSDEIGALSKAFRKMTEGLKEREKLKGAFVKFHSKEIAQKLLAGEIKLGGERKQATVFFSDIRGFTAMSEVMTPDQVVAMLNEYMTEMVKIIYKWKGVVDKYVGDAIMAEWGVPDTTPDDAYNSVRAALEMRAFMTEFNKKKLALGKQELKIGMGIHSGEVLAGNIGSEERLEYTVIGDTVNQSARIEAATKTLKTDFLISENTYLLVKDRGIICGPLRFFKAKGKTEPVRVFEVIGYQDSSSQLITSLTEKEIETIKNPEIHHAEDDEEKARAYQNPHQPSVLQSAQSTFETLGDATHDVLLSTSNSVPPSDSDHKQLVTEHSEDLNLETRVEWFLVDYKEPENIMGPFSIKEIVLKVKNLQFDAVKMHAFKQGDAEAIPVYKLPGMQRKEMPPIETPIPGAEYQEGLKPGYWYIHGNGDAILGPVTTDQIWLALDQGNITRTTWVWGLGYQNWIYVFELPDFERRQSKAA